MSEDRIRIVDTMPIREVQSLWHDQRIEHLQHWAETFGVCLKDFHAGHIRTYQLERSQQVAGSQVDAEIGALLALLGELGLVKKSGSIIDPSPARAKSPQRNLEVSPKLPADISRN